MINLAAHKILVREQEIHLTPKEFDLLVYLFQNRGKVITHRTLLGAIWGGNYTEQTEYLRVFIGQLRKKIEADSAHPHYILTEPWLDFATKNLYELFINRLRYPYILGLTL